MWKIAEVYAGWAAWGGCVLLAVHLVVYDHVLYAAAHIDNLDSLELGKAHVAFVKKQGLCEEDYLSFVEESTQDCTSTPVTRRFLHGVWAGLRATD